MPVLLTAKLPRAWLRCPEMMPGPALRKVARNSIGRSFNKVWKRCNSNDLNSRFEIVVGELRAELGVGAGMTRAMAGCGAWSRCWWVAAGPGRASSRRAERSSRRGRLAGGPPHTSTHSGPARRKERAAPGTSAAPQATTQRKRAAAHRAAARSHSQWNTQRSRWATTSATWTALRAAPLRRLSPETTRTRPRLPSTA